MKKKLICGLLIIAIMAAFAVSAVALTNGGIVPMSAAATWSNKTITQTSQTITYGAKTDTTEDADVYISDSDYPYSTAGMDVRIYDYTLGRVASSWATYYYWGDNGSYQYRDIPYNSGKNTNGSTMYLNLRIPSGASITGLKCSGKFYP